MACIAVESRCVLLACMPPFLFDVGYWVAMDIPDIGERERFDVCCHEIPALPGCFPLCLPQLVTPFLAQRRADSCLSSESTPCLFRAIVEFWYWIFGERQTAHSNSRRE